MAMKRSQINRAIQTALEVLNRHSFYLPPFAYWTPEQWRQAGPDCERIKLNGLGWDVTDLGRGDFDNEGAVLFTLRNGNYQHPELGTPYAEKVIIMTPGQSLPLHFHWSKTEDIINRGGGVLVMEFYASAADESVDRTSPVRIFCDGRERILRSGESIRLLPGESVTIPPRLYHRFWAGRDGGILICGEVSSVNDDRTDNRFAQPSERFVPIVEDEPARYLLWTEYP